MTIRRYISDADTTITNAFEPNLIYRATGSNMGESDSMEVFSLYGQVTTSSVEISRALVKFPMDSIISDRNNGLLPASGSVTYNLRLFNATHPLSLPREYYLSVYPLSQSWDEGYGLDMETYLDPGEGRTKNGFGTNWIYANSSETWNESGSSFLSSSYEGYKQFFKKGYEDLNIDITNIVEKWISGDIPNNGLIVKLSGNYEDGSQKKSFFTKKFFTRGSEFFYKKPIIEAAWEEAVKDDRGNFFATSSLLSDEDNTQNLFFYNRVNGKLKNINGNPEVDIKFYTDKFLTEEATYQSASVTNPYPGIYKASAMVYTTSSVLYDKWFESGSFDNIYYSSSLDVNFYNAQDSYSEEEYIYSITNLKSKYSNSENATIRIFSRLKNWSPNIYSVATNNIENSVVKNLYYRIFRIDDGYEVIPYSTGSVAFSKTSYDSKGNYFNLDMSIFEPDYSYGIQFARYDGNILEEIKQIYKFRVE